MLATLAEFRLIEMILRDQTSSTNRDLAAALEQAGFLHGGLPRVAAVRVPMETEYRTLWELPYDPVVKTKLFYGSCRRAPCWDWTCLGKVESSFREGGGFRCQTRRSFSPRSSATKRCA